MTDAAAYLTTLHGASIQLDAAARARSIWTGVTELVGGVGGHCPASESLLAEVTNLVESPTVLLGAFDPRFLQLPRCVW